MLIFSNKSSKLPILSVIFKVAGWLEVLCRVNPANTLHDLTATLPQMEVRIMLKDDSLLQESDLVREINDKAAEDYFGGVGEQVILYKDADFQGEYKHIYQATPYVGDDFNDKTSSIIVAKGTWMFYLHSNYGGPFVIPLRPGLYPNVTHVGIINDNLSSLKPV